MQLDMLEKALERMATSEQTTLVTEREPDGKMRVHFKELGIGFAEQRVARSSQEPVSVRYLRWLRTGWRFVWG